MKVLRAFLLVSALCCSALAQYCASNTFYYTQKRHTMCISKEKACPGFKLLKSGGLTAAHKKLVLEQHNSLRNKLVKGQIPGQPAAASMKPMVWSEELATIAQRAADQCKFAHDENRNVKAYYVGQNIYMAGNFPALKDTEPNFIAATTAWWDEVKLFSSANIKPFKSQSGVGHYTQMAWAETSAIGCGYVMYIDKKKWSQKLVFCNYGPGGNIIGGTMYVKK